MYVRGSQQIGHTHPTEIAVLIVQFDLWAAIELQPVRKHDVMGAIFGLTESIGVVEVFIGPQKLRSADRRLLSCFAKQNASKGAV